MAEPAVMEPPDRPPLKSPTRLSLAFALGLVLSILGARWAEIDRWGMDAPMQDQWDAEGRVLLAPWLNHDRGLGHFFAAHNEHRVALTRAFALLLTLANRQWDQRMEAVCNAWLPALLAAGLLLWVGRYLDRCATAALAVLLAILYCAPFAWENITHGFHSQQFFLIDFAVLAIATFPLGRTFGGSWWIGLLALFLSLGSMATGFVAGGACAVVLLLRIADQKIPLRAAWPSLSACSIAILIGLAFRTIVPGHRPLIAHTPHDFFFSLFRSLGWPGFGIIGVGAIFALWCPWVFFTVRLLRGRLRGESLPYFVFGLGLWVLVQVGAAAYARGSGGGDPAPRYLDNIMVGLWVNALALILLGRRERRFSWKIGCTAWALLGLAGFTDQALRVVPGQLAPVPMENFYSEANVRNYLATGDAAYLAHPEELYPNWIVLKQIGLDIPALRAIFPASIRQPLALIATNERGFVDENTCRPQSKGYAPRLPGDGLSPTTAQLPNVRYHGSYTGSARPTQREWRSAAVSSSIGGWLQFWAAGDLGTPGTALELHDATTGRLLNRAVPPRVPGDSWHTVYLRAPGRPFYVEATVASPGQWLAFSDPVEMGALSHLAWRAARNGAWVGAFGAGILLATILTGVLGRKHAGTGIVP